MKFVSYIAQKQIIDTPQGKIQVLELAPEWWTMHHNDMKVMEEWISTNHTRVYDDTGSDSDSDNSGDTHSDNNIDSNSDNDDSNSDNINLKRPKRLPRRLCKKFNYLKKLRPTKSRTKPQPKSQPKPQPKGFPFPPSISILKKIILARAACGEFIKIRGLVDSYFYLCAHSPEVNKHRLKNIKIDLGYAIDENKTMHTTFSFQKVDGEHERLAVRSRYFYINVTKSLEDYPFMIHALADNKNNVAPLLHESFHEDAPTSVSTIAKDIFYLFLDDVKNHTGDICLKLGSSDVDVFSVILNQDSKLTYVGRKICRFTNEDTCFSSENFFIIQHRGTTFTYDCDDDKNSTKIDEVLKAVRKNGNRIRLFTCDRKIKKSLGDARSVQLCKILKAKNTDLDASCYSRLRSMIKVKKNSEFREKKVIDKFIENTREFRDFKMVEINYDLGPCTRHILNELAKEDVIQKTLVHLEDAQDVNLNSACARITDLNLWLQLDEEHWNSFFQFCELPHVVSLFRLKASKLCKQVKRDSGARKVVQKVLDQLIAQYDIGEKTLVDIMSQFYVDEQACECYCDDLFLRKGEEFSLCIDKGVAILCTGQIRSQYVYQAMSLLFQVLNMIYDCSLEAFLQQRKRNTKTYFEKITQTRNEQSQQIAVTMVTFGNILKWCEGLIMCKTFDIDEAIAKDTILQLPLLEAQMNKFEGEPRIINSLSHIGKTLC